MFAPSRETQTVIASLTAGALACVAIAFLVFHFDGFMGPDSGARFSVIRSWANGGSLLYLDSANHGVGSAINDPLVGYTIQVPRGACTVYPPLFTGISGLLYFALGKSGLVVLPLLGGLFSALFGYLAARSWGLASRRWVPLLLLFASPLLLYASTFWDHSCHMALVAAATWLLLRAYSEPHRRWAVLSGVCVGIGVYFHELLLVAGACFCVALVSDRRLLRDWLIGFVPCLVAWAIFNRIAFGALRGPHLMGPLEPTSLINLAHLVDMSSLRDRTTMQLAGGRGTLDVLFVLVMVSLPILTRLHRPRAALAVVLGLGALACFLMCDQPVAFGLFQTTPWLLFAWLASPPGLHNWQNRAHRTLLRAATLFLLLVVINPISPGLNWGSRYLLTILPVLALLALRSIEHLISRSHTRTRASAVGVLIACYGAIAVVGLVRGTRVFVNKIAYDQRHIDTIARIESEFTATDLWWLGPEVSTGFARTKLRLVAYVPATQQLTPPLPPDPNAVVRSAFFASLPKVHEFTFAGSRDGLEAMRKDALSRSFTEVESHQDADLIIARFADSAVAASPVTVHPTSKDL